MFDDYFTAQLANVPPYTTKTKSTHETYRGISKIDYPDWEGWSVIKMEKKAGVHISKINNEKLNTLVRNFYHIKYIEEYLVL